MWCGLDCLCIVYVQLLLAFVVGCCVCADGCRCGLCWYDVWVCLHCLVWYAAI